MKSGFRLKVCIALLACFGLLGVFVDSSAAWPWNRNIPAGQFSANKDESPELIPLNQ